jgi:hypothetical protein
LADQPLDNPGQDIDKSRRLQQMGGAVHPSGRTATIAMSAPFDTPNLSDRRP